jgi:hypothetical protein
MKGYFRLKRGAKYYKWDEEVIINGEADPFHTENKELGLLKKKKIRFISIQNNDMEVHE